MKQLTLKFKDMATKFYNENHIAEIKNNKVISFVEKSQFSSVALFKAFEYKDLDMKSQIAIVTYSGLTNYHSMYNAVYKGQEGVDFFSFTDSVSALNKMNELRNQIINNK